jgi:uncharacterized membrane protein
MSEPMGSIVAGTMEEVTDGVARFARAAPGTYISPWEKDSNHSNHTTTFRHGLGVIPTSVLILFSVDQKTVYPLQWSWEPGSTGNPVTIAIDNETIILHIFSGQPLHGVWDAHKSAWTKYSDGYWKVIASA